MIAPVVAHFRVDESMFDGCELLTERLVELSKSLRRFRAYRPLFATGTGWCLLHIVAQELPGT